MPTTIGTLLVSAATWATGGTAAAAAATSAGVVVAGVTVAQVVGTIALTGLSIALRPGAPKPTIQKQNIKIPVCPRRRGYGRIRVGGAVVFLKRSTVTGNGILYMAVALHSGEIDAIEEHWISDQITRTDEDGSLTGNVGQVIYPAIWTDDFRVTVRYELGKDSQPSSAMMQAAFPGAWTAQHRLDGIAYSKLRLKGVALVDFSEVYKFGVPTYTATIRASKIFDPRASGQDVNDPDTWAWSDNAALVIMDYLWHADGMRLPWSMIESALAEWIAIADYCDEEIPLLSGLTEPRYRLWAAYDFTEPPKSVLGRMLGCIDGRLRLNEEGSIVLDVGQMDCPTGCESFSDADVLAYDSLRRGADKSDLVNEIRATYLSPGHNYLDQEADPLRDEESVLIDGLQSATLDLTFCPSHRQARARMKIEAYRRNPEWQGTIITNATGLRLLGKRYARFQISDLGLDAIFFIQRSDINLLRGVCTFQVISFPAEAYCWNPIEEGFSPEHETPGQHGIAVPPGATSVTIRAHGGGGGGGQTDGGGGGAMVIKTLSLTPADEGSVFRFTVGAAGMGHQDDGFNLATDGGTSTVVGTVAAGSINLSAGGGLRGTFGGTGGAASGGDINLPGTPRAGGNGGEAASGAIENESPGGGGHEQVDGGMGSVTFEWVY